MLLRSGIVSIALFAAGAALLPADSFLVTYSAAGVQAPSATPYYETFDSQTAGTSLGSSFVTSYNSSPYTGTYTGGLTWAAANLYGGAGGTGVFPTTSSSYSVTINPTVNYFGLWFSALDGGNSLQFYNGNNLLYTFTPSNFISLVGACPGTAYCGNPNAAFLGQDNSQQYAYLNFYDSTGMFNKIVVSEVNPQAGFESDNQAVAVLSSSPGGTPIPTVPEPGTFGLVGGVAAVLALGIRQARRRARP